MRSVTLRLGMVAIAALLILAAVTAGPVLTASAADSAATSQTTAEHAAEATKYDAEAADLEAKASRHNELSKNFAVRGSGGSKQATALKSLAKHCQRLASAYSKAAKEARELAELHRELAVS